MLSMENIPLESAPSDSKLTMNGSTMSVNKNTVRRVDFAAETHNRPRSRYISKSQVSDSSTENSTISESARPMSIGHSEVETCSINEITLSQKPGRMFRRHQRNRMCQTSFSEDDHVKDASAESKMQSTKTNSSQHDHGMPTVDTEHKNKKPALNGESPRQERKTGVDLDGDPLPSKSPKSPRSKFSAYLVALRPWSFTVSLTPVALGSCLAYKELGQFNILIFVTTCLIALSVHAAGNLVNSYFDYMRGVDSPNSDEIDRTLVDRILTPNDVATMGAVSYFCGCVGFLILVIISPAPMNHLALVYFGGLSGSFLYTGGLGLKYIALGDIVILMVFGPVTVLFAYMSQGGPLSIMPLLYAVPMALNTESILHSNNTRDMKSDAKANIITLAILLGQTWSYVLFAFLLFTPYIIFGLLTMHCSAWFFLPVTTVFLAFRYERLFRFGNLQHMPKHMTKLNLQMGLLYILACFMSQNSQLPGLIKT